MRIKFGDIIIGAVIIAAAVLLLVSFNDSGSGDRIAVITRNNEEVQRIDLEKVTEPVTVDIGEGTGVIIIAEQGKIRFLQSDCPDQTCVNTGWIDNVGETAVCLPNRVIVKIIGEPDSIDAPDIIAE